MATQLERRADAVGYDNLIAPAPQERRFGSGPQRGEAQRGSDEGLALALGWFSIGLGLAEVLAPRQVAEFIGVKDNRTLFRFLGAREIASGIGILTQPRPAGWLWSRVAGDIMDLALLSTGLDSDNPGRTRTSAAVAAVLGVTALDLFTSQRMSRSANGNGAAAPFRRTSRQRSGQPSGIHVAEAVTVNRPVEEIYDFWHDFKNLSRFMTHLASVEATGSSRTHWTALGPAGIKAEWDAETVEDRPNELIAWRSLPGGDVDNAGSVRFSTAPGDRGTEVVVDLRYDPPGGIVGATLAKLFGEAPEQLISRDLRAFKQLMEVGEVVNSDASIHRGPHPARPSAKNL